MNPCRCKSLLALVSASLFLAASTGVARAIPTPLVVHVLAHDAKLIGSAAGGVRVRVVEADTGRLLAEGLHLGGTGSTDRIIREPWVRGEDRLDTEGAAFFRAELELDRPTWVRIEATGPLGFRGRPARASRELLLLPGVPIEGDGVVLELQGLIVHLLEPHAEMHFEPGQEIAVRAGVKLLCTCPIEPGGLWNADDYEVRAELWHDGDLLESKPLGYDGQPDVFAGRLRLPALEEGEHWAIELRVSAHHPGTGNAGVDFVTYRIGG